MGTAFPKLMAWGVPIMADAALKGVVLLGAAGLAMLAMRRASAAMRHLVWSLAIMGLLALPVLSALLPQWQVLPQWPTLRSPEKTPFRLEGHAPSWPEPEESVDATLRDASGQVSRVAPVMPESVSDAEAPPLPVAVPPPVPTAIINNEVAPPANRSLPWREFFPLLWIFGAAIVLMPVVVGRLALWRLCRGARRIETTSSWTDLLRTLAEKLRLRQRIALLRSDRAVMPMAWGIRRARILLPGESDDWPAERRRLVLLHEMAHIHRRDCLTQFLTNLACAMHWFNPLVWIARRRMVAERERACDDLVLAAGFEPSDYAQELLHVASGLRGGFLASGAAIAMARPSKLEGRLLAILDASRKRVMTRRGIWFCVCALTVCAILLACTATPFLGGPIPIETLMANYKANPNDKTSQALADVLSFRNPSKEEAEEILRLIMQTKISVRDKYAEGKAIYVLGETAHPFRPNVYGFSSREGYTIFLDGKKISSGGLSFGGEPGSFKIGGTNIGHAGCGRFSLTHLDLALGKHQVVVRINCKLWPVQGEEVPLRVGRRDWIGTPPVTKAVNSGKTDNTGPPLYEVEYDVPVTINVVPDEEAEEIELVTNPELDGAVRAAVEVFRHGHNWISRHDDRIVRGDQGDCIRLGTLPIDLVCRVRFQDETGKILNASEPSRFIRRANQPALELNPGAPIPLDHYPLGVNRGTLIFTPDPELAYRHPDIKNIWGGTLEIPVEFEVSKPGSSPADSPAAQAQDK